MQEALWRLLVDETVGLSNAEQGGRVGKYTRNWRSPLSSMRGQEHKSLAESGWVAAQLSAPYHTASAAHAPLPLVCQG